MLLRRALDLRTALRLGVYVDLCSILADEFHVLLMVEEEEGRYERERGSRSM